MQKTINKMMITTIFLIIVLGMIGGECFALLADLMNRNLFVNSFLILSLCLLLFRKSKYQPNMPWNKLRKSKYNLMMILIKPSVTTDNIPWYTEIEYCQNDINCSVNSIDWSFKDEIGEEMSEDDDVGLDSMLLDYFLACFLQTP
jgi:hypothetical protein